MAKFVRTLVRKLTRLVLFCVVVLVILTATPVLALKWLNPPTSSFMFRHYWGLDGAASTHVYYQWTDWVAISEPAALAVIASEDQRFREHFGFDVHAIKQALEERQQQGRVRGASTISQQVAKNMFLWPGRSWVRKGLEVYFTVLIELSWSKQRILEVYLNIAQFGPDTFGVGATANRFFEKSPSQLTHYEAALMAAVLPNPYRLRLAKPSEYVHSRAKKIASQAKTLGPDYLSQLTSKP